MHLRRGRPPARTATRHRHIGETRRRDLIARYVDGHRVVLDAVCGATDREFDARPEAGGWTAGQAVHHLADSEMTSAIRLRRLLAEERPQRAVLGGAPPKRGAPPTPSSQS